MVKKEHVASSLRLVAGESDGRANLRTFAGIRHNVSAQNVHSFLRGFNAVSLMQAANAVLTSRAVLIREL